MAATIKQLVKRVRATATYGARLDYDKQSKWQRSAHGWTVRLTYKRRSMTVDFWTGAAITAEPDAASVLECLCSDAAGIENARGFEDWAAEYGYDTDSREAEATFRACQRQTERLRRFLGADFAAFMGAGW